MAHLQYTDDNGNTHEVVVVHKRDHEGALMVERASGMIVTPLMERPDWAEGLAVALIVENLRYYQARTGPNYVEPTVFDFADLGWIGVSHDQEEVEIFADPEMRQERLAHLLHIDRETGDIAGAMAEVEHAFDQERSPEEAAAIEDAQEQGFDEKQAAVNE